MEVVTVGLVDDSAKMRESLTHAFSLFDDIEVCFTANDGQQAVDYIAQGDAIPQVLLMDIEMPRLNGIKATQQIKAREPGIKIIMLSVVDDVVRLTEAVKAGADGYLLKDEKLVNIREMVIQAAEGRLPLSPLMANQMLEMLRTSTAADSPQKAESKKPEAFQLTAREQEVLRYIVQGDTYQLLAEKLFISPLTVRSHTENIYRKLGVNSKAGAISIAIRNGWF